MKFKAKWGNNLSDTMHNWMAIGNMSMKIDNYYKFHVAEYMKEKMDDDKMLIMADEELMEFELRVKEMVDESIIYAEKKMTDYYRLKYEIMSIALNNRMI